jgi:Flp pilus assembly protein TadB
MRTLGILVLVCLIVIVGLGFYLGWFKISTSGDSEQSHIQVTIDKEKMRHDASKLKEGAHDLKEQPGKKTDAVPDNR